MKRDLLLAAWLILCSAVSAPAQAFTAEGIDSAAPRFTNRLEAITAHLASDALQGRDNDTSASRLAQDFLIAKLARFAAGLDSSRAGDGAYRQPFTQSGESGTNIVAIIPGRELPDEYVLIGAHYDHLGTRSRLDGSCNAGFAPGGKVCKGASDNAASVAEVLEIGRAIRNLPVAPRRSIVLALWDAEEDGLLGSFAYVNHPLVSLERTVAYVNLDIQGSEILPSLANVSFAIGSETGQSMLEDAVRAAVRREALDVPELSYIFGQLRSDYANFVPRGVPTVFFSDSTGGCYHTTGDDIRTVSFAKLLAQTRISFRLVVELAESTSRPSFAPPSALPATYDDAVAIARVIERSRRDLALFRGEDRETIARIASDVNAIVERGAQQFDANAAAALLGDAAQSISLTAQSGCRSLSRPVRARLRRFSR